MPIHCSNQVPALSHSKALLYHGIFCISQSNILHRQMPFHCRCLLGVFNRTDDK
jgi:hypothetical protein